MKRLKLKGRLRKLICFTAMLWLPFLASALTENEAIKVRTLINLMDYIAKDYQMAVENGEVINTFEYAEMMEFSSKAQSVYRSLSQVEGIVFPQQLQTEITALQSLISDTAEVNEVAETADFIRDNVVSMNLVPLWPHSWPDLKNGSVIFSESCASCHGEKGDGNGPASKGLTPAPTDFTNPNVINQISPLQAYNTITLGIEGTSMRAFTELSDKQTWDLAFYILSIQHSGNKPQSGKPKNRPTIGLEEVATLSNQKLVNQYGDIDIQSIRTKAPKIGDDYIQIARSLLQQSQKALTAGNMESASNLALKAYLQGVEPIEPRIKASDNSLFQELEQNMMNVRSVVNNPGVASESDAAFNLAFASLDKAESILGTGERSLWMTSVIALSILLREGLEAFLVILAILGILQSMNAQKAIRWVHGGWVTAVLFGLAGWFFADALMQWDARNRELMEGVIALVAVGVLLYLGFWMHGKTNASRWKHFVETRVKGLISQNNMIGLASFSFLVVFREAFESVLFLSSLTADGTSESSYGVMVGAIASAVLLFGIAWSMLKWFKKLPIQKVFLYSSLVMLALAFILAGEGIHAIQEGGYIAIRSFPLNLRFSLIGLYPTYESIIAQLLVFALIVVLWKWSSNRTTKSS